MRICPKLGSKHIGNPGYGIKEMETGYKLPFGKRLKINDFKINDSDFRF